MSADQTADRLDSFGGKLRVSPFDVFDAGGMAVIVQYPRGAVLTIREPKKHKATGSGQGCTVCWSDLCT